jgi:flagellar biosynthesis protein FlhF
MRLKTFYAKTMSDAMQQVRDTLGEDAVIIATRDENGGKSVRVTAAIEQMDSYEDNNVLSRVEPKRPHFELDTQPATNDRDEWDQYDAEEEFEGQITEQLTDVMLRHVVPNDVMDSLLATAAMTGHANAEKALSAAIDHLYSFVPLPSKSRKALMLVGPPGAGKTLMTAKLATQAVMDDLNVAVITTDTVRAGGVEQLQAFTKILKIPLHKAKTREELNKLLNQAQGHDLILIDTAGTNPHDPDDMARVARLADAGSIEPILAMTAGVDAEESAEIARSFALLGVRRMVTTRMDIARRLGGLLAAAQKAGMSFSDASFTPKVTDGVAAMNPSTLAKFLINPDHALRAIVSQRDDQNTTNKKTAGRA